MKLSAQVASSAASSPPQLSSVSAQQLLQKSQSFLDPTGTTTTQGRGCGVAEPVRSSDSEGLARGSRAGSGQA